MQPPAVRDPAHPRSPSRVARWRCGAWDYGDEGRAGRGRRLRRTGARGRAHRDGSPGHRHRCWWGAQRHAMSEHLEGSTYQGQFLVADIAMEAPIPRDQGNFFCGPDGMMLLAPLPGGRWLTFQDLEEEVQALSAEEV